ncbi:glycosyl-4,4'-diaponeurosporenoate acyltransferase CrtO family protein [Lysobacter terrae]
MIPPPPILRSAVVFCVTAIVFAICFLMLGSVIGGDSPWLGLLLMFYFMGLAKVGEPLFVLRMPQFLREVRAWEATGTVYRRWGVERFGWVLRLPPLRFLNASVHLANGQRDLSSLYRHAASSEATHFWAALLFMPYIAFVWTQGRGGVAAFFLLIQVLFNVYPILHLRLLRGRLAAMRARRGVRAQGRVHFAK